MERKVLWSVGSCLTVFDVNKHFSVSSVLPFSSLRCELSLRSAIQRNTRVLGSFTPYPIFGAVQFSKDCLHDGVLWPDVKGEECLTGIVLELNKKATDSLVEEVKILERMSEFPCKVMEGEVQVQRRFFFKAPMIMCLSFLLGSFIGGESRALVPAVIDKSKEPSKPFDATDKRLQDAATTFQKALNATTVVEEEQLWTEVIEKYGLLDAEWVPDIVSRAYGNRGNARSRQGKLEAALEDYDKSIMLAPYAVDPVLNRGVALENLGRYDEASADYIAVLRVQPKDPAAWNNLGNVKAAQNRWEDALISYGKAVELAPVFSFAAANYALVPAFSLSFLKSDDCLLCEACKHSAFGDCHDFISSLYEFLHVHGWAQSIQMFALAYVICANVPPQLALTFLD